MTGAPPPKRQRRDLLEAVKERERLKSLSPRELCDEYYVTFDLHNEDALEMVIAELIARVCPEYWD